MLSVIMSFILSVVYAECHKKPFMLNVTNKPFMLSVTNKPFMLSVITLNIVMLSVIMPNVMVPYFDAQMGLTFNWKKFTKTWTTVCSFRTILSHLFFCVLNNSCLTRKFYSNFIFFLQRRFLWVTADKIVFPRCTNFCCNDISPNNFFHNTWYNLSVDIRHLFRKIIDWAGNEIKLQQKLLF